MKETIDRRQAADVLFNIATIIDANGGSAYRVRAYRRAARIVLRESDDLSALVVMGRGKHPELNLPGLGPRLRRKLGELVATGRMEMALEVSADGVRDV